MKTWEAFTMSRKEVPRAGQEGALQHGARVERVAAPCDEVVTSKRNSNSLLACRWLRAPATTEGDCQGPDHIPSLRATKNKVCKYTVCRLPAGDSLQTLRPILRGL